MADFKIVSMFTDDIQIVPHSATDAAHIGKPISIRDFTTRYKASFGQVVQYPYALYENTDTGELRVELRRFDSMIDGPAQFIEGPEYCCA